LCYEPGGSALGVLGKFGGPANLKFKFGNHHFWKNGYYVSTVGLIKSSQKKYIQEQENADRIMDKVSMKEPEDTFMGSELQCKKAMLALYGAAGHDWTFHHLPHTFLPCLLISTLFLR
jgi:putative transposase